MVADKLDLIESDGTHNFYFHLKHNLSDETMNKFIGFARFVKYSGDKSIL